MRKPRTYHLPLSAHGVEVVVLALAQSPTMPGDRKEKLHIVRMAHKLKLRLKGAKCG